MLRKLEARPCASSVEMMHTGMCRVVMSFLSRSMTRQPSISGRQISSVIASGLNSFVIASAAAPNDVTNPLKPFSRAASSNTRAKARSFSTIKMVESSGFKQLRSSPTSLTSLGVSRTSGWLSRAPSGRVDPFSPFEGCRPPCGFLRYEALGQEE